MIGFFPDPYPDEVLYSICARYQDRVKYENAQITMRELFGYDEAVATIDFPKRLNYLIKVLPQGHHYTVEQLINNHTLLPFYSPFCPPERVHLVREHMKGDKKFAIHFHLGVLSIPRKTWMRFCPLCAVEDKRQFGEYYWHRLHQVPGVEVCPIHAVFLEESNVRIREQTKVYEFISAEKQVCPTLPRWLNLSNTEHEALLKIARDAAWLLKQNDLNPGLESLHKRYIKVLVEKGLATHKGTVYKRKMIEQFNNFYSSDFLNSLHCEIDYKSKNPLPWIILVVRKALGMVKHPIRHLLVIHFIGYTAEEFFNLSDKWKPFGDKPWPCLNPVCDNFQKLCIEECQISYSYKRKSKPPVGKFCCTCGFTYYRVGPDLCAEDIFRYNRVESYGTIWEMALKNLWEDLEISLREIGRRLGISKDAIKSQAIRLGLPLPRLSSKPTRIDKRLLHSLSNSQSQEQNKLETYRSQWLSLIEANPNANREFLINKLSGIHKWLARYDSEWLEAHKPPRKRVKVVPTVRVNWEKRDAEWTSALIASASRMKNSPGHLVRITKNRLCKDIGQTSTIRENLNKLPLTCQTLTELAESYDEFAIRKILRVAECFRQENIHPTSKQLIQRACVSQKMAATPQVNEIIDAVQKSFITKDCISSAD
ncbi:MAG TPA: TnsD family transposase [Nostoc sp.]|uniref:TnsD family transposase n=1 Tax=Nostoc sp. TaxID=1180 RepID=UPI002D2FC78E|nr:TnsD family transposase [Nostoc sp.]HYX16651.1 TnsD family transposase [Nostoc sp.]